MNDVVQQLEGYIYRKCNYNLYNLLINNQLDLSRDPLKFLQNKEIDSIWQRLIAAKNISRVNFVSDICKRIRHAVANDNVRLFLKEI